ncbi:MAG: ATP-binding protein [Desulfatirhabdiaceae bacterium]
MSNPTILIVEDEAVVSADIANKLRKLGYGVTGSTGAGEEAIELARHHRPSLVLMDIHLAGAMDGIATADAIRREFHLPVVFLTAHSDKATLQRAKLVEAFGYILKPFDDRELHTQIEIALYKHAAEQRLRDSQSRLATFVAATFEGIIEIDAGRIVDCNEQFARMLDYPFTEMTGMEIARLIAPEDRDRVMANILQEQKQIGEYGMFRKDGTRIIVEAHGHLLSPGKCLIAIRDITSQKNREERLQKLNRTLSAINHSSAARMHATDEGAYLQEVCRNIVVNCGHAMVWIGYTENDVNQSVRPVASDGIDAGYLETLNVTYADTERGLGPTGTAIRTGQTSICRNIRTDPLFIPWREDAIDRGYASSVALPLKTDGRCFGAISIYSNLPDSFCEDEITLLTELADDLAYGITSLRLRAERNRAVASLQKAHNELEQRVLARTADLLQANESLGREMEERRQVEAVLRESEERLFNSNATLTMTIDGISDPLFLLDAELRVKRLNRAARDYYGLTGNPEAVGKRCFEAFRKRSRPCEGCERPFSGLRDYSGSYERKGMVDPDRIEQVFVYLVRNASGTPEATIVRIADITQTRMMDRQLIQNEKLASLGLLVSGIAHEINNPNNFIFFNIPILRSYLQFLLPIVDEHASVHPDLMVFGRPYPAFREDCFKLLNNIEHGSTRINQIVRNLREFARERGKGEMRRVDVKQVVEKGISICLGRINKTVKSFESSIPEGLPEIFTDPLALEQILVNLLINAAQAADKADSRVTLRITGQSEPAREVIMEVSDNGCGMDSETQKKIFDPFFTTKESGVGTGLGLSISHRLVTELGGRIEVQSQLGKGSIFRVRLGDAKGKAFITHKNKEKLAC